MDYFTYRFDVPKVIDKIKSGAFLKHLRNKYSMRQNQLAEQVGADYSNISHIEAGRLGTSDKMLEKIINIFNAEGERVTYNDYLVGDIGMYEHQLQVIKTFPDAKTYEQLVTENETMKKELSHLRGLVDKLTNNMVRK